MPLIYFKYKWRVSEDFRFEKIIGKDSIECYKQRSCKNKSNLIRM